MSPLPLRVWVPAKIGSDQGPSSWGTIAVTPVRTGPRPRTSGPSPRTIVAWPTRIPATSVIALCGPGLPSPMTIPRSRARTRPVIDGRVTGAGSACRWRRFGGQAARSVGLARGDDVHAGDLVDRLEHGRDRRRAPSADREVRPVAVLSELLWLDRPSVH